MLVGDTAVTSGASSDATSTTTQATTNAAGIAQASGAAQTQATTQDSSAKDTGTVVSTTATSATPPPDKTVLATWPSDWRQQLAGDDKTFLGQLERYSSPNDLARKIREQDKLISSGQLKQPLPKDATPEQIAEYRKANGIPESPDKYDVNAFNIGEQEKPVVGNILKTMHDLNLPPEAVNKILSSYYGQRKEFETNQEKQILANRMAAEDELRKEWGGEYRGEINRIENLLNTYSMETQRAIQFGKDNKGMPLLSNASFLRDLAVHSRMINPVTTVVPGSGGDQMQSVDTEIASIEQRMADDRKGYFKDEKMQARYRDLLQWRENQKERR